MKEKRTFVCAECKERFEVPFCSGRPTGCPVCQSNNIYRVDDNRGGRGHCRHRRGGDAAGESKRHRGSRACTHTTGTQTATGGKSAANDSQD